MFLSPAKDIAYDSYVGKTWFPKINILIMLVDVPLVMPNSSPKANITQSLMLDIPKHHGTWQPMEHAMFVKELGVGYGMYSE